MFFKIPLRNNGRPRVLGSHVSIQSVWFLYKKERWGPQQRGTPVITAARQRPGSCPFSGVMMGSKMASASRVVQVVKPQTPLIRFPDRRDSPKPNVSEVLRSAGLPSHTSSISQHSKGSKSPDWLMHQGPPDTAEKIKTLPQKYRRKLVSQEEI